MEPGRCPEPTTDEIAACAYLIYEAEGCPHGRALAHWLQAKAQLIAAHKHDAGEIESLDPAALHPARRSADDGPESKT